VVWSDQTLGIIDSLIYILINGKQSSHFTKRSKFIYGSYLLGAFFSKNSDVKSTNWFLISIYNYFAFKWINYCVACMLEASVSVRSRIDWEMLFNGVWLFTL